MLGSSPPADRSPQQSSPKRTQVVSWSQDESASIIKGYLEAEFLEEELELDVLFVGVVVQVETLVLLLEVSSEELDGVDLGVSNWLLVLGLGGLRQVLNLGEDSLDSDFRTDGVSGWENVVQVDELDERLNSDSSFQGLLGVALGDSLWSSVNTNNEAMWVSSGGRWSLAHLDDDGLSTSISATEENNNSAGLDDLSRWSRSLVRHYLPFNHFLVLGL